LPILGDFSGLSQALMNLCTNARDAMPAGGQLSIEAKTVGNHAELIVSDTGHGMSRETLEKCFDPFFTTKAIGKGTGLGLSTTYGIVKSHEGLIRIKSEPEQGTVISIILPLTDTTAEIKEQPQPAPQITHGNGETILVVDDEEQILKAMQNLLNGLGYQPEVAESGKAALDKYAALKPEVVLMDINMPEMDGISCAEKIFDLNPDAKLAFISGYEIEGLDEFSDRIKAAIQNFLTKPVELADLSALLSRMLPQER
jgi:CheY-like chemotaxis protein